jgi:hypothetical protein
VPNKPLPVASHPRPLKITIYSWSTNGLGFPRKRTPPVKQLSAL